MPQVGPLEILVVATLALIVFGAERLPEMARSGGRYLKQVRSIVDEMRSEFETGLDGMVEEAPNPEVGDVTGADPETPST